MFEDHSLFDHFSCCFLGHWKKFFVENQTVLLAVAFVAITYKVRKYMKESNMRQSWDTAGKDVVVMHASGKSAGVPHASPFAVKLDMYMRMAGIPFKNDNRKPFGPKGKIPWITLNGEDLADSQIILDFLNSKFEKNLNSHLSKEQEAVSTSMRIMIEEHLLWGMVWWRFSADREYNFLKTNTIPWTMGIVMKLGLIRRKINSMLWAQGMGRHSEEIIIEMMTKDIDTLSVYLGEKPFLMGDDPCEVDCTLFGFIAVILWGLPGNPWVTTIMENYPNLNSYCNRVKERFYPDWDQCLLKKAIL